MFFIFSFFLKKKVSSFLFSCISFKYVLLLALVSELNCFLRSRCSMEMWCPDDTRRDSWDWVGPPVWGRACFNAPQGGGGYSPVKKGASPDCIIVVVASEFQVRTARASTGHGILTKVSVDWCMMMYPGSASTTTKSMN